jgi:hypothetical protein
MLTNIINKKMGSYWGNYDQKLFGQLYQAQKISGHDSPNTSTVTSFCISNQLSFLKIFY